MTVSLDAATTPLSPSERRERNRREMVETILAAARAVMREHGVAALNMNEVARRVRLRPQSLAEYFPTKAALYDALLTLALDIFRDGDERAYRDHPPGWDQIEAWFANRVALADDNPDLHHLALDAPIPDYVTADRVVELSRGVLDRARRMVADAVAVGALTPGMPVDRATDLLLSIRHGIAAERIGKRPFLPSGSDRFTMLVPDAVRVLRAAWGTDDPATPTTAGAGDHSEGAPMPD